MKTACGSMFLCLFSVFAVSECSSQKVVGRGGQDVTLPCKYNVQTHGALTVCWGRGEIPTYGCRDQIILTDGGEVREESRVSVRYQLRGNMDAGDVSLTILNVSGSDAGQYGCRVQILGWFNDEKHYVDLTVHEAPEATASSTTTHAETERTPTRHTPDDHTPDDHTPDNHTPDDHTQADHMNATSSPNVHRADEASSSSVWVVLVCVLFAFVALLTAVGVVMVARRWKRLDKTLHTPDMSWVRFSTSAGLHLTHSRGSAVENIYQMEEEPNEYESCR